MRTVCIDMMSFISWWKVSMVMFLSFGVSVLAEVTRFKDKPFDSSLEVHGRTVSCNGTQTPGRFAGPTWTCADLKVDGLRLSYGFTSPKSAVEISENGCDSNTNNRTNDYAQLCREMMAAQKDVGREKLWSAFITDGSCDRIYQKRLIFRKDKDAVWHVLGSGRGYVRTLQCMLYPGDGH